MSAGATSTGGLPITRASNNCQLARRECAQERCALSLLRCVELGFSESEDVQLTVIEQLDDARKVTHRQSVHVEHCHI